MKNCTYKGNYNINHYKYVHLSTKLWIYTNMYLLLFFLFFCFLGGGCVCVCVYVYVFLCVCVCLYVIVFTQANDRCCRSRNLASKPRSPDSARQVPVICLHGVTGAIFLLLLLLLQHIPCCHADVVQDAAGTHHLGGKQRPDLQGP